MLTASPGRARRRRGGRAAESPMTTRSLTLEVLPGTFAVCRLAATAAVPEWASGRFLSVTRTDAELSVVCAEGAVPPDVRAEGGWRCLRVRGPLGFGLTGVLASLASPLASSGVSIFVISTYDTDYLMVQSRDLDRARDALERAGHTFAD
jgi:hypothetical protein